MIFEFTGIDEGWTMMLIFKASSSFNPYQNLGRGLGTLLLKVVFSQNGTTPNFDCFLNEITFQIYYRSLSLKLRDNAEIIAHDLLCEPTLVTRPPLDRFQNAAKVARVLLRPHIAARY